MGMKQTEIGEIPEDWDLVKLGEIGENFIGLTYSPSNVNTYGTLVLRSSNVQNGQLAFKDNVYVKMDLPARVIAKKNDILICVRNGSRQLIGKCALINEKAEGSAFGAFMTIYRTDYFNFILHQFNSEIIQKQIRVMMGATINQITNKDLKSFIVPLPREKKEQDIISNVLSDTDNLIQATEQLINKKKLIKTATMQNLLTGKIRLAEFDTKKTKPSELGEIPSDWEVKKLGDLLDYEQPTMYLVSTSKYLEKGSIPVLTAGKSFVLGYTEDKHGIYRNLPVIIFDDFTTDSKLVDFEFKAKSSAMKMLVSKDKSTPLNLIFALLQNVEFIVGDHKRHWISEFRHLNVAIPKSIEERNAISKILADLDRDINALKNRLGKLKDIKQGLMQNLLTGKIRLTE